MMLDFLETGRNCLGQHKKPGYGDGLAPEILLNWIWNNR